MASKQDISPQMVGQFFTLMGEIPKISVELPAAFHGLKALLNSLSKRETCALVLHICDREPLLMFKALDTLRWVHYYHKDRNIDDDYKAYLHSLVTYPGFLVPFIKREVPVDLWQQDAKEFADLFGEYAAQEKIFDESDPRFKDLVTRNNQLKEKLSRQGYKMHLDMGEA